MSREPCMLICANLDREVRAVSGLPEFRDINFTSLPVECDQVEAKWEGLADAVQVCQKEGRPVCLVGSYCLTRAAEALGLGGNSPLAQKEQCVDWVADKDVLSRFLQEGAVPLLPGWLKNWEHHVEKRWASDRKKTQTFFRDLGKKIVLLDTGVYPKVESSLKAFGHFLHLPYDVYEAGLVYFRMSLGQVVLSWRFEHEKSAIEEKLEGLRQEQSDYARIGHLFGAITKAQSEDDAASSVLEIFRVLISPQKIAYHPVLSFAQRPKSEGSPQDRILSLNADYAWTEDHGGFFLKIACGREILGVLEVSGLTAADRRDHNLNLGLALAKMAGLGLKYAKTMRALEDERAKSVSVEAALKASEENMRSVFGGVPVGIYRTTPSGNFMFANPAMARMLGYPDASSLEAVNSWDLHLNPGDRESWQSVLEGGHFVEAFETQLRRRDGTIIWVKDSARAVKDSRGQVLYYDGVVEDITRRKQSDAANSWNTQVRMSVAEVSSRLLSPATIEEMSGLIHEHVRRLTSSLTCFVGYVDRETGELVPAALTPDARDLLAQHPAEGSDPHALSGLWGWVLKNKKPILTNLPTLDPRFKGMPEWHFHVGQFLCAPAVMSGKLVGLIAAANSDKMYSEKDLDVVERLATFYAIAIHRVWTEEELRELSLEDELTKLNNRRGFMTLAEQQFRVANRSKKEMFLLYADLDDLKTINDTLGHEEGDVALVETASILKEAFRESDIIARVGGDEFVVLAIDAGDGKADVLNWRLREKIDALNAGPDRKYVLSLSLGTARYDPEKPCSIQDLINRADKRMYEDKLSKKSQLP